MKGLLIGLLIGVSSLIMGALILFSKRVLNWMFEQGMWRIGDPADERSEKRWRRIFTGGGLFVTGIIITVWVIIAFFMYK